MLNQLQKMLLSSRILSRPRAKRKQPIQSLLRLEHLEERTLPAPLTWSGGANLPAAQGGVVAAQASNGATVVLGGASTTVADFFAAYPSWQTSVGTVSPLDDTRSSPGIGVTSSGALLVFGGNNGGAENSAILYDYTGNTTLNAALMHTARTQMGFATDSNNNVYAIGGLDDSGNVLSSVESYNQTTNTWTVQASLPKALYGLSAAADGAGHIFAFGGIDAGGNISSSVYRYTIATNTWDTVASLPVAIDNSAAVLGPNGLIYVLGGVTSGGTTAAVESYNETTNAWTTETSLPAAVSQEAATVDSLGRIVVAGGFDAKNAATSAIYFSHELSQPDAAPVITSTAPTAATAGVLYNYQVLSTGNPQATYSLTAAPAGMTIDPGTGLISWTPTLAQAATQTVTVQASNFAGSTTQTFSVTASLSVPVITSAAPKSALVNAPYSFTFTASGTPAPTFTLVSGPADMTLSSTGVLSWTPSYADEAAGPASITIAAANYSGQATKTYTMHIAPPAPTGLTATGASTSSIALSWTASIDPNVKSYNVYRQTFIHDPRGSGGSTVYTLVGSGIPTTSATIGGLRESGPGTAAYTYVVTAVDSAGVESARSTAASSATLYPPDLYNFRTVGGAVVSSLSVQVGQTVQIYPDSYGNEAPTYSIASGPSTVSIDPITGLITYTPGPTESGNVTISVKATNSVGSSTNSFVFVVTPAATIAPNLTWAAPADITYGTALGTTQLDATATDPTTGATVPGTFTYSPGLGTVLNAGVQTLSVQFTPTDTATYSIASTTVSLNVLPAKPSIVLGGPVVYNGSPQNDSATALGIDGVTPVIGTFTYTYNGSSTAPTNAGSYTEVATFNSSDPNYGNATGTGSFTIGLASPAFSALSSPTIVVGTASTALSGNLAAGGAFPTGNSVSITLNGVIQTAIVDAAGNFSSTFATGMLTASGSPYSITFAFTGDANFNPAAGSSTLTVHVPTSPPPSPPSSPPPAPFQPPELHKPPLLAFMDAILGGIETVMPHESETVIDRFFGFQLFVSTYDSSGNLESVTLIGFNITFVFV